MDNTKTIIFLTFLFFPHKPGLSSKIMRIHKIRTEQDYSSALSLFTVVKVSRTLQQDTERT